MRSGGTQSPVTAPPSVMRARTRWGWVAVYMMDSAAPSEAPSSTSSSKPASSATASMSCIRSSSVPVPIVRSDNPVPRLSKIAKRVKPARRRKV